MYGKESYSFSNKRGLLLHCLVLIACILLSLSAASCSLDNTRPSSTFRVYMYDGNIEVIDTGAAPDYYPEGYYIFMKMEDLPDNEKILYTGACYSTDNAEPDTTDHMYIFDESDNPTIQGWDWDEDGTMIWGCLTLTHLTPGETYYIRGYVVTDRDEYYTDTMEFRSEYTAPLVENPEDYEIPVIFHIFPDESGGYPGKAYMADEMISYANHVYSGYFAIPKQSRTGVRFVPATHDTEGNPLQTPGVVYEKEAVRIDYLNTQLDRKYIWDMEKVLNVWVCPIDNATTDLAGFSCFPFFDSNECMEGCDIFEPGLFAGIFLNSEIFSYPGNTSVFAHEAGHFLGLHHVFTEDYCNDTPWYDYDAFRAETNGMYVFERWNDKERWWSDNVMDYDPSFLTGFTPEQAERIQYTLDHAYFIPGEAGKTAPQQRSIGSIARFGKPVH